MCCYWYFKDIGFKYEPYLCNGCHSLMQKAISFNDVAIVYVDPIEDGGGGQKGPPLPVFPQ